MAFASVGLSLLVGLVYAYFLLDLAGRFHRFCVAVLWVTVLMPPMATVFAVLRVWGNDGFVAEILGLITAAGSWDSRWLYGLPGILLVHIHYNAAFVGLIIEPLIRANRARHRALIELYAIPVSGLIRILDIRAIIRSAPLRYVFLICMVSFVPVIVLGGGPASTTLEIAMYQLVAYEGDFAAAGGYFLCHLAIVALVLLGLRASPKPEADIAQPPSGITEQGVPFRHLPTIRLRVHVLLGAVVCVFTGLPVLALLLPSSAGFGILQETVFYIALGNSVGIGLLVAAGATPLVLALAYLPRHLRRASGRGISAGIADLGFVLPTAVVTIGVFLLLRPFALETWAIVVGIVAVGLLGAIPLLYRVVAPIADVLHHAHSSLFQLHGVPVWAQFGRVEWPLLLPYVRRAFAIAGVLSLGDLAATSLLGGSQFLTLSLLIWQLLGSYRFAEAGVVASGLAILAILFMLPLLAHQPKGAPKGGNEISG